MQQNNTDSNWEFFEQLASEAMDRRHYGKASHILKEALEQALKVGDYRPILFNRVSTLAALQFEEGDLQSSASLYRLLLQAKINSLGSDHPEVQFTQESLIKVLNQAGWLSHNKTTFV